MENRIKADQQEFEQMCYEAYQLDWMMSHRISLQDAFDALRDNAVEQIEMYLEDPECTQEPLESYKINNILTEAEDQLQERGFGSGSLFVCKDEFLGAEYLDPCYMDHLLSSLPNGVDKKAEWENYTGLRIPEKEEVTEEEFWEMEDEKEAEWREQMRLQESTTSCGCRFSDCSECGSREMCI